MAQDRVLVVDDDAALRSLLVLICRRAGFEVDVAKDGGQALECIARNDYLVAILDLQMPHVNGFDVIQVLRARSRRPAIIVMTALPPSALAGLDANVVQAVVRKPFEVDLLTGMLTELAATARSEWAATTGESEDVISPN